MVPGSVGPMSATASSSLFGRGSIVPQIVLAVAFFIESLRWSCFCLEKYLTEITFFSYLKIFDITSSSCLKYMDKK